MNNFEEKSFGEKEVMLKKDGGCKKPLSYVECAKKLGFAKLMNILFIESRALKVFLTNFLLTYNVRAGISLLVRLLTMIAKDPTSAFSLKALLDEHNFQFREEAVRTGLLVGLYTSIYKALLFFLGKFNFYRHLLARKIPEESLKRISTNNLQALNSPSNGASSVPKRVGNYHVKSHPWHAPVAGFFAGFSILAMDPSWHRSLGLYMATRLVQCIYHYNRDNNKFHFWGSQWNHGDSLLFALSSAQLLYAYVMRPETLPTSYFKFLVRNGPIDLNALQTVKSSIRDGVVDSKSLLQYVIEKSKGNPTIIKTTLPYFFNVNPKMIEQSGVDLTNVTALMEAFPLKEKISFIPMQVLHAYTTSSVVASVNAWLKLARLIFPVYLALALVPSAVLRYYHFLKAPITVIQKSVLSAVQSTIFLSTFTGGYNFLVSLQRKFLELRYLSKIDGLSNPRDIAQVPIRDFKSTYWFAGLIASLSILMEKSGRRSELALYALPRAVDSLFLIMLDRKLMFSIPHGEVLLFCTSMSGIMFFYENHQDKLSPLVSSLLGRFLHNDIVFKDHERLEDFNDFDELESESWEDQPDVKRTESDLSFSGSIVVPV